MHRPFAQCVHAIDLALPAPPRTLASSAHRDWQISGATLIYSTDAPGVDPGVYATPVR